ncbi:MAG: hypothetical protein AB1779_06850 [Candidatus Thermoplasmatota archaeon]
MVKYEGYHPNGSISSTMKLVSYSFSGGKVVRQTAVMFWCIYVVVAVIAVVCIVGVVYPMIRKKAVFQPQYPQYQPVPSIETTTVRCGNRQAILTIPKPQGIVETQCPHCGTKLIV